MTKEVVLKFSQKELELLHDAVSTRAEGIEERLGKQKTIEKKSFLYLRDLERVLRKIQRNQK